MGKTTGFLEIKRVRPLERAIAERVKDHQEFELPWLDTLLSEQGARCMDCGVPTCHGEGGCPLGNLIPDWNDLVMRLDWKQAIKELHRTNPFPEWTGRICPAPCEEVCVLGINDDPVTIKAIEKSIIEHAFTEGWVLPQTPVNESGKRVAIIGSGPAGLAAAQILRRLGHSVHVFEKNHYPGGLLTYGIPNFKLEQAVVARRIAQLTAEGVQFQMDAHIGQNIPISELQANFDAILLAIGAEKPRPLPHDFPGKNLDGIHLAMDFLTQQNRRNYQEPLPNPPDILAHNKQVVILGGGDTGADCLGTAIRQQAQHVYQLEITPQPKNPKTGHSHHEGGERRWSINTQAFLGENNQVKALKATQVEWVASPGQPPQMKPIPATEFVQPVDLVLLAMGFLGPSTHLLEQMKTELAPKQTIQIDSHHRTNIPNVFAAGDCVKGASLVVWAIQEGRDTALHIHQHITNQEIPYHNMQAIALSP